MKITKYEHACLVIEKNEGALIIDPGTYTDDFEMPKNVAAVLITHSHPDHNDPDKVSAIMEQFPDCKVYAHQEVAKLLQGRIEVSEVALDQTVSVADFRVKFVGGTHALIHESIGRIANLGILIDDGWLYYPGDSFFIPDVPVTVLALPVSAPWAKIAETVDFLNAVRPQYAFPTHDGILSQKGKDLVDGLCSVMYQNRDGRYERIQSGHTKLFNEEN